MENIAWPLIWPSCQNNSVQKSSWKTSCSIQRTRQRFKRRKVLCLIMPYSDEQASRLAKCPNHPTVYVVVLVNHPKKHRIVCILLSAYAMHRGVQCPNEQRGVIRKVFRRRSTTTRCLCCQKVLHKSLLTVTGLVKGALAIGPVVMSALRVPSIPLTCIPQLVPIDCKSCSAVQTLHPYLDRRCSATRFRNTRDTEGPLLTSLFCRLQIQSISI